MRYPCPYNVTGPCKSLFCGIFCQMISAAVKLLQKHVGKIMLCGAMCQTNVSSPHWSVKWSHNLKIMVVFLELQSMNISSVWISVKVQKYIFWNYSIFNFLTCLQILNSYFCFSNTATLRKNNTVNKYIPKHFIKRGTLRQDFLP